MVCYKSHKNLRIYASSYNNSVVMGSNPFSDPSGRVLGTNTKHVELAPLRFCRAKGFFSLTYVLLSLLTTPLVFILCTLFMIHVKAPNDINFLLHGYAFRYVVSAAGFALMMPGMLLMKKKIFL